MSQKWLKNELFLLIFESFLAHFEAVLGLIFAETLKMPLNLILKWGITYVLFLSHFSPKNPKNNVPERFVIFDLKNRKALRNVVLGFSAPKWPKNNTCKN